jgi:hypothetical protein
MKCVFNFSPQLSFKKLFTPVNIQQVALEICREKHIGLHAKHQLLLSNFIRNWYVHTRILTPTMRLACWRTTLIYFIKAEDNDFSVR